jgi:CheY-like chemotaxis protein
MKQSVKILLVDDEQDLLDMFGMLFDLDGAETSFAHSYSEALDLLDKKEFDIVVTDYKMPRMHGIYLLEMIKDKNPRIPVIIMSAYLDEDIIKEARLKKADLVLRKPFEYADLLAGIHKLLKKK